MSVTELQRQKVIAEQAYNSGKITQADYNAFNARQDQLIAEAKAKQATQPQTTQGVLWQRTAQGPVTVGQPSFQGALPAENPAAVQTSAGGLQVRSDYDVVSEAETAEGKVVQLQQRVEPKPSSVTDQYLAALKVGGDVTKMALGIDPAADSLGGKFIDLQLTPAYVGAGMFGALESNVYGTAALVGSAKKSVETGRLQYAPGFEGFNSEWKTPHLAPTVSGAVVGLAVGSPVEAAEIERLPYGYAIGAGLGEAGLLAFESVAIGRAIGYGVKTYKAITPRVNAIADKAASRVAWKIYDKGYTVIEPAYQKFNRVSSVIDKVDVQISNAYASRIGVPLKYGVTQPAVLKVERAGQTVKTALSNRVAVASGKFETRVAPKLERGRLALSESALAQEVSYQRAVTAPRLQAYSTSISSKVTAEYRMYKQVQAARKAFQVNEAERTVAKFGTKPLAKTPKVSYTKATTSTKNISTFDALKMAKKVSKQGKKLDRIQGLSIEETSNFKPAMQTQQTKTATVQLEKEVLKPRAMKIDIKPISGAVSRVPYPRTQRVRYEEETVYLTKPGEILKLDKQTATTLTPITVPKVAQFTSQPQPTRYREPTLSISQFPTIKPDTTIRQIQPQMSFPATTIKPASLTVTVAKQTPQTKVTPKLDFPNKPFKNPAPFPTFSLGGGGGGGGFRQARAGKWYEKKHKIKTPQEMLNSFGMGKTAKGMTAFDKSIKRMTKSFKRGSKKRKR